MHFISASCQGETCRIVGCGQPATHKVGEEIGSDAPRDVRLRHNLTAYVCCDHFRLLFGNAVECPPDEDDPDGVLKTAQCLDCGRDYENFGLDLLLPRWQWLLIHPDEGGLLCANCIVLRASQIPGVVAVHAVIGIASPEGKRLGAPDGATEHPPDLLVGVAEAAEMFGVHRSNFIRDYAGRPEFPAPVAELASGRVWDRAALERYKATRS